MKRSPLCLLSAVAGLVLAGCTSTTYTDPSGAKFSRTSFLTKQSASKVEYSDGTKKLTLDGYSNEQTETAAAVAGAVASALAAKGK